MMLQILKKQKFNDSLKRVVFIKSLVAIFATGLFAVNTSSDFLSTNKNTTNSFYMGYPIQDWYVFEYLEKGETFSDINIEISENLKLAKESAIKRFNDVYNTMFS